ncbi:MAG: serine/threonine protein kinase, partial [Deltaproteobacteria bacterium]|nr:serine/threonine protein kinase [Deltaproteobacteria bacterium]
MAGNDDQGGGLERTDELAPTLMLAGKYRLGRLLGEGGMGAVYEAEHLGLGTTVAVKLLGEGSNTDPKSIARFKREAKAMGQIKHENVVRVMDTGTDDYGLPYLVMEVLDGESLSAVLRREKRLKPNVAVEVACQILAGLNVAHSKGVVHRDLKPGNVFIASMQDGTKRVKILDFGISKLHDSTTHNVTAEGALVGTPNFMAPEQITGESDTDTRIDVYAVGVLLYRMISGKLPYVAKQADELYKKILAAKPTRPRDLNESVPPELEAAVLKAMSPDRSKRFVDAREFEMALRELYPTQEMFGSMSRSGLQQLVTISRSGSSSEAPTVAASPRAKPRRVDLHGWTR